MGELSASPPPPPVDPRTTSVHGVHQISRRVDRDEPSDAVYALRRSRRGGRSRRDKKQQPPKPKPPPPEKKTILKRLSPADLASLAAAPPPRQAVFGAPRDYDAHLRDLQLHREWYLLHTAAPDPPPSYFPLAAPPDLDDPPPPLLWSPRCRECDAAAAAARQPPFHRCVRDAVTVGFRSHVGPIERPHRRSTPSPPPPATSPPYFGMSVY